MTQSISLIAAFNTIDWNPVNSTDYFGPDNELLPPDGMPPTCKFSEFREDQFPYHLSVDYFKVMFARFAFVLVFQNVVYGLTGLLSSMIPDVPSPVKTQIQREKLLAREVLFESELKEDKKSTKKKRAHLAAASGFMKAVVTQGNTDDANESSQGLRSRHVGETEAEENEGTLEDVY